MKTSFLYILFFLVHTLTWAQTKKHALQLIPEGKTNLESKILDSITVKKNFSNYNNLEKEIQRIQQELLNNGYLDMKFKGVKQKSDTIYKVHFQLNKKYTTITIAYDPNIFTNEILSKVTNRISPTHFTIPIHKSQDVLSFLTSYLIDQGNTFTSLQLSNIEKKDNTLIANLEIKTSEIRTVDKINIKGYTKFPKGFIKHYSRIKTKQTFNKTKLLENAKKIDNLPFSSNSKPPEVLFAKDSTLIFLYLKKQAANTFDGFLGFTNDSDDNSLQLNGYLNLQLINNLNFGEKLRIEYKNDGNDQQRFEGNITLPYLFKTPIGIEGGLQIFKRDTTFLITQQNISLNYLINDKSNVFLGYASSKSNSLLDIPQPSLNLSDYTSSFLRAGFRRVTRQDNSLFPIKNSYHITAELGSRKTNKNTTDQLRGEITIAYIIDLNKKNSIFLKNETAALFSENVLINELYRFGGINSIRGFEENTINASLYNVVNTEYRYLLSPNLFIHSIIDYAYFEDNSTPTSDNLTSFGFGLGLKTQTGIFRILFANGKNGQQNFEFSNTKVHLSLNARF